MSQAICGRIHVCIVSRTHDSFGDRSFSASGPCVWNASPSHLRQDVNYTVISRNHRKDTFGETVGPVDDGTLRQIVFIVRLKRSFTYLLTCLLTFTAVAEKNGRTREMNESRYGGARQQVRENEYDCRPILAVCYSHTSHERRRRSSCRIQQLTTPTAAAAAASNPTYSLYTRVNDDDEQQEFIRASHRAGRPARALRGYPTRQLINAN